MRFWQEKSSYNLFQNYKIKECKGCLEDKTIVYVSGQLCMSCNQTRLTKRYVERAKSKPLFSKKAQDVMKKDSEVYRKVWDMKPHYCEECSVPLANVEAEQAAKQFKFYFSHILKKGMYGKIRHDLRNFNLLCFGCHDKWESADTRKKMKIFEKNKPIMIKLLKQYGYHA